MMLVLYAEVIGWLVIGCLSVCFLAFVGVSLIAAFEMAQDKFRLRHRIVIDVESRKRHGLLNIERRLRKSQFSRLRKRVRALEKKIIDMEYRDGKRP